MLMTSVRMPKPESKPQQIHQQRPSPVFAFDLFVNISKLDDRWAGKRALKNEASGEYLYPLCSKYSGDLDVPFSRTAMDSCWIALVACSSNAKVSAAILIVTSFGGTLWDATGSTTFSLRLLMVECSGGE
jgi:hypothetical protein